MAQASARPAPAPGEKRKIRIIDVAFGGEGVGRDGDLVIFVPFVIPGEEVEVEIAEIRKNFARARLLQILQPSSERVQPRCPYFMECGGCQYQHVSYSEQLRVKHKQICDLFERVGRIEATILPVAPSPREYGYRNRIMIRTQWNKPEQRLNIGFVRFDNRLVVDIDHCPISEPEVSDAIRQVRGSPPPKGGLKVVLRKFPADWEVPKDSFFQNNFFLLPELARTVREFVLTAQTGYLIDLYCGVGFFGIELAGLVERFVGVELDTKAIEAARKNARKRSVENGEFRQGAADELLPGLLEEYPPSSVTILIDPPRTGCPAASLELLRRARPKQIVYVSCNPATLARDLNILCAEGVYGVKKVRPLDMFPQTQHVECVADVRLKAE